MKASVGAETEERTINYVVVGLWVAVAQAHNMTGIKNRERENMPTFCVRRPTAVDDATARKAGHPVQHLTYLTYVPASSSWGATGALIRIMIGLNR